MRITYNVAIDSWRLSRGVAAPIEEYRFHGTRRWRFDFAWPQKMLAVEVNGGVWVGGRHNRSSSIEAEYEKLGTAAAMGWRVITVTPQQVACGKLFGLLDIAFEREISARIAAGS